MPTNRRTFTGSMSVRVDVLFVECDLAHDPGSGGQLVHPVEVRRKVVLPQPEEPISAVTWCGSTVIVTSCTAWKSP